MFANMHNHSTFSDGAFTPEEIAKKAKELGYKAVVLTDHDTVQGHYFMQKAARKEGLLTMLGCEFSTLGEDGTEFHLLGFDFNPGEPEIRERLRKASFRMYKYTELLLQWAQEKGRCTEVTWQEVCDTYPYNEYLCNDHIFRVLVAKGARKPGDKYDFFEPDFRKTPEKAARVEAICQLPPEPPIKDVIAAIRKAGGVPILAHPHNQIQYIPDLIEAGLMGVEANHPDLTDEEVVQLHALADRYGLYRTGGTDHSGVLGGTSWLPCELPRNSVEEKYFMELYTRALG